MYEGANALQSMLRNSHPYNKHSMARMGRLDESSAAACNSMQGLLVTVAIGLHNVPEGLAVATVLVAKGISPAHAFWWTLATSLPQPLLALPSFMFVDAFQALLPLALGFAAGCMVWIVFAELLPDALADAPHPQVSLPPTIQKLCQYCSNEDTEGSICATSCLLQSQHETH